MKKYYLLHYVGNFDEQGKPSFQVPDICEETYVAAAVHSKRHQGLLNGRKPAQTIGVSYEDGTIIDYCLGQEVTDLDEEGKLRIDSKTPITELEYLRAYRAIHQPDRRTEFMNVERYLVAITALSQTKSQASKLQASDLAMVKK